MGLRFRGFFSLPHSQDEPALQGSSGNRASRVGRSSTNQLEASKGGNHYQPINSSQYRISRVPKALASHSFVGEAAKCSGVRVLGLRFRG